MANYNASSVGVPYIRVPEVSISYTTDFKVNVVAHQDEAVKLADGSVRVLQRMNPITFTIDLVTQGSETFPLVNPSDGSSLGASVTNTQIMLSILAAIRAKQLEQNT
jgi:hypothetical protein